uniref:Uncharacterized protein n=1 Tax=Brassica oleracea TaxID=3712 RepID=A0A3P6C7N6_BRAOL|nr:unnamed protein product [Brassica oleracea]
MPSSSSHCCKPTRTVIGPSPLYPPIMEAPPPTRTRFQGYYSGYGQLHPPPLCPFRDVNTTEKDNMRVAFLFLEPGNFKS